MDFDMNWWGLWSVPLGVAICFGPVILAWAMACRKADAKPNKKDRL